MIYLKLLEQDQIWGIIGMIILVAIVASVAYFVDKDLKGGRWKEL